MEEVIIECESLARFHVKKEDGLLIKNIIKMCKDYGLNIKMVE